MSSRGLAERTRGSLLFTFAPSTRPLVVMHAIGKLFPRADRAPAIEPVRERLLRTLIADALPGARIGARRADRQRLLHQPRAGGAAG